jgi:hypothetical protein
MFARRWVRAVTLVATVLLLSGCALFAPSYDPLLDAKITEAYEGVARLQADVEMGSLASPDSYDGYRGRYADMAAALAVAQYRASLLTGDTDMARWAASQPGALARSCNDQIMALSRLHQQEGLQPGAGVVTGVMVSCDVALRAAQARKR